MSIEANTTQLNAVLEAVRSLPTSGTYQRYAGTFTYDGGYGLPVECGFAPDFVVIQNIGKTASGEDADLVQSDGYYFFNNIVLNFAETFGKIVPGYDDPFYGAYTNAPCYHNFVDNDDIIYMYVYRTASGFSVSEIEVIPASGSSYYLKGTYHFTAFKFT